ncbi:MAG TPA: serine/threonine-protein kinase [Solirubrobacteraceae bacterium]|jgi:serine/threonine-protein kinase|nr:serine/threonine-protein kinase [Solirubrobacteraceae bacterium]
MGAVEQLERYQELRPLGAGGMGEVVLAQDAVLGRSVALKRLRGTGDPRELMRLRREALVGASLSHPNLVSVYDVVSEDDELVVVMEFIDGPTLRDALRAGPMEPEKALEVIEGVAEGLEYIHARGIVHRDVKPANILLGAGSSRVKLGDLGIASSAGRTSLTTTGAIVGTVAYMAPEQLEGQPATPAVDVFALATVAFEALTGRRARGESNPVALAHALTTQPPPDVRDAWPDAPAGLAAALAQGLARDPQERPPGARALAQALRDGLERPSPAIPLPAPTAPRPPAPTPAPSRRVAASPTRGRLPRRPPTRDRGPLPRGRDRGFSRPLAVVAGGLALLLVAASAVAILGGSGRGGSPPGGARSSSAPVRASSSPHSRAGGAAASGARAIPAAGSPRSSTGVNPAAGSPAAAVVNFYELSASHRYAEAWALAAPGFRDQLRGFDAFRRQQSAVRSIVFHRASVTREGSNAATVTVRTTSTLVGRTDHCSGTVQVLRQGGAWLVDRIAIDCV